MAANKCCHRAWLDLFVGASFASNFEVLLFALASGVVTSAANDPFPLHLVSVSASFVFVRKTPTDARHVVRSRKIVRGPSVSERLVEVGDDVADVFDADREAHHIRPRAGLRLLLIRQLAMRGGSRMDDE